MEGVGSFEAFGAFGVALSILSWVVYTYRQDGKEKDAKLAALEAKNEAWVARTVDQFVPLITASNDLLKASTETVVRQQEALVELRDQLRDVSRDLHEFEKRLAAESVRRDRG
jgi:small-conductance mechanosensitive channel